ncbi:MAG: SDR family oxidoreductase [Anaerolineales bacterium]
MLRNRYGSTALITGASAGIGKTFAYELAKHGLSLVLVARRKSTLENIAADIRQRYGVHVTILDQDLAKQEAAENIFVLLKSLGMEVDILVNNAGLGLHAPFTKMSPAQVETMLALNCYTPVMLTHKLLPGMKERGRGAVIIVSSAVGQAPIPNWAMYSAAKSYLTVFAESLYGECQGTGVDVLAVLPGDTTTEFRTTGGLANRFPVPVRTPEQVVQTTFRALGRKPSVVDGIFNLGYVLFARLAPRRWMIAINKYFWRV